MGRALEIILGFVTAPDTTLTALTMAAGNSATVRSAKEDSKINMIGAWADNQTAGILRIRSPRMHDNVENMRFPVVVSNPQNFFPKGLKQKLFTQDTLALELSGSATGGDIETAAFLIHYEDLPGINANLIDADALMQRMVNLLTIENTLSTGTSGGWSGEEAIDAEYDLLKANTDYALVGYVASAECAAVRWRGVDFGNLGVGGPGIDTHQAHTVSWFKDLSEEQGLPLIPVFNSANKSSLLIDCAQDEDGGDPKVGTILAELSPV